MQTQIWRASTIESHPVYGKIKVFDEGDTISREVLSGREWEPHIVQRMAEHVIDGTDFVDVGANIGLSTLGLIKRSCGRVARAHCFEPNPDAHALLRYNLRDLDRRHGVACAVSSYGFALRDGLEIKPLSCFSDNIGGCRLPARGQVDDEGEMRLETAVLGLDSPYFCNRFAKRRVSVMKIDAETSEEEVIAGAESFLATHSPVIFIEIVTELVPRVRTALGDYHYEITEHLGGWDYIARKTTTGW